MAPIYRWRDVCQHDVFMFCLQPLFALRVMCRQIDVQSINCWGRSCTKSTAMSQPINQYSTFVMAAWKKSLKTVCSCKFSLKLFWQRSKRNKRSLSVAVCDYDHFIQLSWFSLPPCYYSSFTKTLIVRLADYLIMMFIAGAFAKALITEIIIKVSITFRLIQAFSFVKVSDNIAQQNKTWKRRKTPNCHWNHGNLIPFASGFMAAFRSHNANSPFLQICCICNYILPFLKVFLL